MKASPELRRWGLFLAAGLAMPVLVVLAERAPDPPASRPSDIAYGPGKEIARLANRAIKESSGLAASRVSPGVFWTHNDAGNTNHLFAFNLAGEDLGAYRIEGARSVDWEDMAAFTVGRRHFLLIADVGDNLQARKSYTLYLVVEPGMAVRSPAGGTIALAGRVEFTYEDGPHNCESVGVDPVRKEILLVSKVSGGPCKAYVLPLPRQKIVTGARARAVGELAIPTTTGMDVSPDGLRAMVLTYGDAYEFTRQGGEDWKSAFARRPRLVRMPRRAQGESICYALDGKTLYLTSEKKSPPLLVVQPLAGDRDAAR